MALTRNEQDLFSLIGNLYVRLHATGAYPIDEAIADLEEVARMYAEPGSAPSEAYAHALLHLKRFRDKLRGTDNVTPLPPSIGPKKNS